MIGLSKRDRIKFGISMEIAVSKTSNSMVVPKYVLLVRFRFTYIILLSRKEVLSSCKHYKMRREPVILQQLMVYLYGQRHSYKILETSDEQNLGYFQTGKFLKNKHIIEKSIELKEK